MKAKFTESFIVVASESNPVGYPLPPAKRTPPSLAHLPPDPCIIFCCFSVFPYLSSPGYMTPALPTQPGHGSLFHPFQYETTGPADVVQEIDTVANQRSVSTFRYFSRIQRRVSTLPLNTGLQGRISIPPSTTGHERGHTSPNKIKFKSKHPSRLQHPQRDGGRKQTQFDTATGHYNLCSHMDNGSHQLPTPPTPRALRHMARSLRAHTCSPPLPSLPRRRLLPTATMANIKDEKHDLDFGPYSSDDGENARHVGRRGQAALSPRHRHAPRGTENAHLGKRLSRTAPGHGRHDSCAPQHIDTCGRRSDRLGTTGVARFQQCATRHTRGTPLSAPPGETGAGEESDRGGGKSGGFTKGPTRPDSGLSRPRPHSPPRGFRHCSDSRRRPYPPPHGPVYYPNLSQLTLQLPPPPQRLPLLPPQATLPRWGLFWNFLTSRSYTFRSDNSFVS